MEQLIKDGELILGDGYRTKRAEHGRPGIPILRVAEVLNGRIEPAFADYVSEHFRSVMGTKTSQPGDIVLTTKGTVGRVALVTAQHPEFVYSPQVCFFRLNSESVIVRRYLYYWFRSTEFWRQAVNHKGKTDMADYINLADIRSLELSLPNIAVQQGISEVLGALDDKIAVNARVAATSMRLAASIFEDSEPTVEFTLGDIAEVFDGPHATPKKTEDGPWFLSISSLKSGLLDLDESAHLGEEDYPRWTKRVQPRAGDVLFSYETRLGDAALMLPTIRACLGRRMGLIRSRRTEISGPLLLQAYLGNNFQSEISKRAIHGATVDRIPIKELPRWPIKLPASRRWERLSTMLKSLSDCATHRTLENRSLAQLRDTLLPKLMSGRLRIRDAGRMVEDAT
ncbi:restriction endonuclease subunit S [Nonomuraea typhae]|uniref:restriction endonuclease subunit S n=1 Tax=Nonomuraea typhae TaxID=2603600 RepID=UPI0015E1D16C|nr:restriction endonuclease subunit S [Nonomuraea typhae]